AAEHRAVFDAVAERRGGVRGPFTILLQSPMLCRRVLDVGSYLRHSSHMTADVRELAVIATARAHDCPYVWAAHAPAARRAGISDAVVVAVRDWGGLASLPSAERDAVDYVRQLLRTNYVSEAVFDRLLTRYGGPWLLGAPHLRRQHRLLNPH